MHTWTYVLIGDIGRTTEEVKDGLDDSGRPLKVGLIRDARVEDANGGDSLIPRYGIGLDGPATHAGGCQTRRVDIGILARTGGLGDPVNGGLVLRDVWIRRFGDAVRVPGPVRWAVGDNENAVGRYLGEEGVEVKPVVRAASVSPCYDRELEIRRRAGWRIDGVSWETRVGCISR